VAMRMAVPGGVRVIMIVIMCVFALVFVGMAVGMSGVILMFQEICIPSVVRMSACARAGGITREPTRP
jgi:hypothetical protein